MWFDRGEMKRTAKLSMRTAVPNALWVALVFCLIQYVILSLQTGIMYGPEIKDFYLDPYAYIENYLTNGFYAGSPLPAKLLTWALDILNKILSVGFVCYTLCISRGLPAGYGNLFDGFSLFFKIIWLSIRIGIVVFFYSLLLVVPGIIASYKYTQSFRILLDHPDWSAKACMRESKRLMDGHKWEFFVLQLSFIGWNILTVFPFVSIFVLPYIETTYSVFYDNLIGWQPESSDPALPEKAPWEY